MFNGVFTLPDTDTDFTFTGTGTDTDTMGFKPNCIGVGLGVGVVVGQCEHTINQRNLYLLLDLYNTSVITDLTTNNRMKYLCSKR